MLLENSKRFRVHQGETLKFLNETTCHVPHVHEVENVELEN